MEYRATRAELYDQLARIGKVLMHPKRIELLELLGQGERTVDALAQATDLKLTTASAHLQVMRQARLVVTRRDGARIYYRAAGEEVSRLISALGDLARARLAEVDQILSEIGAGQHASERVTRTELLQRVRAGDVVVIDVRPHEEYEAGHIPGARSVPLEHLEAHLAELDPSIEVVAYCRGPLCLLAPQAVATLRRHGRAARCLEDGMPEWRQAGLPVAIGAAVSSAHAPARSTDPDQGPAGPSSAAALRDQGPAAKGRRPRAGAPNR
jgi:rhodanese-related sulfurtransferase/DNA-binding transcriptional ArsR family regulator